MSELNVALVGLGHMCRRHVLPLFPHELAGLFRLQAVCDLRPDVVREISDRWQVPFGTTDYEGVLSRDDVDLVALYTPESVHAAQITKALDAGKHVICTKPMATSRDQCCGIAEAARRSNSLTLVGQTCRWFGPYRRAHEIVESGEIGRLLGLEARYVHDFREVHILGDWRVGESAPNFVFHGVCHPIDTARWFAGDIIEVHALATRTGIVPNYHQEDNFFINVRFESGLIGTVIGAYGVVEPPNGGVGLSVYGSEGSIAHIEQYNAFELRVSLLRDGHVDMTRIECEPERIHEDAVLAYFKHFHDCWKRHEQPMTNVLDNARTISTCAAVLESVRLGKPVEVDNDF